MDSDGSGWVMMDWHAMTWDRLGEVRMCKEKLG